MQITAVVFEAGFLTMKDSSKGEEVLEDEIPEEQPSKTWYVSFSIWHEIELDA